MFLRVDDLQNDWRFEYKYRLTYQQYLQVRCAILPYMRKDIYSLAAAQGRYLVRSLYYDTDRFDNFIEKVNGDCDRVKLRIRTYTATPAADIPLRVEMKARKGITVEKHSTWVDMDAYQLFLDARHWTDVENSVLSEFERYVHLKAEQPKIIVEYLREGYAARSGEPIRATFDHQVRSAHAESLFPPNPFFHQHHPGRVVLEIKCMKLQPPWLWQLIITHGLRICPNSKYTQGIEAARSDVVSPSWSY